MKNFFKFNNFYDKSKIKKPQDVLNINLNRLDSLMFLFFIFSQLIIGLIRFIIAIGFRVFFLLPCFAGHWILTRFFGWPIYYFFNFLYKFIKLFFIKFFKNFLKWVVWLFFIYIIPKNKDLNWPTKFWYFEGPHGFDTNNLGLAYRFFNGQSYPFRINKAKKISKLFPKIKEMENIIINFREQNFLRRDWGFNSLFYIALKRHFQDEGFQNKNKNNKIISEDYSYNYGFFFNQYRGTNMFFENLEQGLNPIFKRYILSYYNLRYKSGLGFRKDFVGTEPIHNGMDETSIFKKKHMPLPNINFLNIFMGEGNYINLANKGEAQYSAAQNYVDGLSSPVKSRVEQDDDQVKKLNVNNIVSNKFLSEDFNKKSYYRPDTPYKYHSQNYDPINYQLLLTKPRVFQSSYQSPFNFSNDDKTSSDWLTGNSYTRWILKPGRRSETLSLVDREYYNMLNPPNIKRRTTTEYWVHRRRYLKGWLSENDVVEFLDSNSLIQNLFKLESILLYGVFNFLPADIIFMEWKYNLLEFFLSDFIQKLITYFQDVIGINVEILRSLIIRFLLMLSDTYLWYLSVAPKIFLGVFINFNFDDIIGTTLLYTAVFNKPTHYLTIIFWPRKRKQIPGLDFFTNHTYGEFILKQFWSRLFNFEASTAYQDSILLKFQENFAYVDVTHWGSHLDKFFNEDEYEDDIDDLSKEYYHHYTRYYWKDYFYNNSITDKNIHSLGYARPTQELESLLFFRQALHEKMRLLPGYFSFAFQDHYSIPYYRNLLIAKWKNLEHGFSVLHPLKKNVSWQRMMIKKNLFEMFQLYKWVFVNNKFPTAYSIFSRRKVYEYSEDFRRDTLMSSMNYYLWLNYKTSNFKIRYYQTIIKPEVYVFKLWKNLGIFNFLYFNLFWHSFDKNWIFPSLNLKGTDYNLRPRQVFSTQYPFTPFFLFNFFYQDMNNYAHTINILPFKLHDSGTLFSFFFFPLLGDWINSGDFSISLSLNHLNYFGERFWLWWTPSAYNQMRPDFNLFEINKRKEYEPKWFVTQKMDILEMKEKEPENEFLKDTAFSRDVKMKGLEPRKVLYLKKTILPYSNSFFSTKAQNSINNYIPTKHSFFDRQVLTSQSFDDKGSTLLGETYRTKRFLRRWRDYFQSDKYEKEAKGLQNLLGVKYGTENPIIYLRLSVPVFIIIFIEGYLLVIKLALSYLIFIMYFFNELIFIYGFFYLLNFVIKCFLQEYNFFMSRLLLLKKYFIKNKMLYEEDFSDKNDENEEKNLIKKKVSYSYKKAKLNLYLNFIKSLPQRLVVRIKIELLKESENSLKVFKVIRFFFDNKIRKQIGFITFGYLFVRSKFYYILYHVALNLTNFFIFIQKNIKLDKKYIKYKIIYIIKMIKKLLHPLMFLFIIIKFFKRIYYFFKNILRVFFRFFLFIIVISIYTFCLDIYLVVNRLYLAQLSSDFLLISFLFFLSWLLAISSQTWRDHMLSSPYIENQPFLEKSGNINDDIQPETAEIFDPEFYYEEKDSNFVSALHENMEGIRPDYFPLPDMQERYLKNMLLTSNKKNFRILKKETPYEKKIRLQEDDLHEKQEEWTRQGYENLEDIESFEPSPYNASPKYLKDPWLPRLPTILYDKLWFPQRLPRRLNKYFYERSVFKRFILFFKIIKFIFRYMYGYWVSYYGRYKRLNYLYNKYGYEKFRLAQANMEYQTLVKWSEKDMEKAMFLINTPKFRYWGFEFKNKKKSEMMMQIFRRNLFRTVGRCYWFPRYKYIYQSYGRHFSFDMDLFFDEADDYFYFPIVHNASKNVLQAPIDFPISAEEIGKRILPEGSWRDNLGVGDFLGGANEFDNSHVQIGPFRGLGAGAEDIDYSDENDDNDRRGWEQQGMGNYLWFSFYMYDFPDDEEELEDFDSFYELIPGENPFFEKYVSDSYLTDDKSYPSRIHNNQIIPYEYFELINSLEFDNNIIIDKKGWINELLVDRFLIEVSPSSKEAFILDDFQLFSKLSQYGNSVIDSTLITTKNKKFRTEILKFMKSLKENKVGYISHSLKFQLGFMTKRGLLDFDDLREENLSKPFLKRAFLIVYNPYEVDCSKVLNLNLISITGSEIYNNKYTRLFFKNPLYYVNILKLQNYPDLTIEEAQRLWAYLGCTSDQWKSLDKQEVSVIMPYDSWDFPSCLVSFAFLFELSSSFWAIMGDYNGLHYNIWAHFSDFLEGYTSFYKNPNSDHDILKKWFIFDFDINIYFSNFLHYLKLFYNDMQSGKVYGLMEFLEKGSHNSAALKKWHFFFKSVYLVYDIRIKPFTSEFFGWFGPFLFNIIFYTLEAIFDFCLYIYEIEIFKFIFNLIFYILNLIITTLESVIVQFPFLYNFLIGCVMGLSWYYSIFFDLAFDIIIRDLLTKRLEELYINKFGTPCPDKVSNFFWDSFFHNLWMSFFEYFHKWFWYLNNDQYEFRPKVYIYWTTPIILFFLFRFLELYELLIYIGNFLVFLFSFEGIVYYLYMLNEFFDEIVLFLFKTICFFIDLTVLSIKSLYCYFFEVQQGLLPVDIALCFLIIMVFLFSFFFLKIKELHQKIKKNKKK